MARNENVRIVIPCPQCGIQIVKSLKWLDEHDALTCHLCATVIPVDEEGLSGLGEIARTLGRLKSTLRHFKH